MSPRTVAAANQLKLRLALRSGNVTAARMHSDGNVSRELYLPALSTWLTSVNTSGPVIVTYLTRVPKLWALGISAAYFGYPLVVVGVGAAWTGGPQKLGGIEHAAQLLSLVLPHTPLVFVDGADTFVANPVDEVSRTVVDEHASGDRVLIGAECNSFPRCYRRNYTRHDWFRACLQRSHTCYLNSGMFLGTGAALLTLVQLWRTAAVRMVGVEKNHDQSALSHLLLEPRHEQSNGLNLSLALDVEGRVFISLYACKEGGGPKHVRRVGPYTLCNEGPYDPLKHLAVSGRGFVSRPPPVTPPLTTDLPPSKQAPNVLREREEGTRRAGGPSDARQTRPLFAHANGNHKHIDNIIHIGLRTAQETEAMGGAQRTGIGRAGASTSTHPSPRAGVANNVAVVMRNGGGYSDQTRQHPVLLLDSVRGGPCSLTELGALLSGEGQ